MKIQLPDAYSITFFVNNQHETVPCADRTHADRRFDSLSAEVSVSKVIMSLSFDGVMDQIRFYEQEKPNEN